MVGNWRFICGRRCVAMGLGGRVRVWGKFFGGVLCYVVAWGGDVSSLRR